MTPCAAAFVGFGWGWIRGELEFLVTVLPGVAAAVEAPFNLGKWQKIYFMKTVLPSYVPPPAHCGSAGAGVREGAECRNAPGAVCG
jgi:hypothetical protein